MTAFVLYLKTVLTAFQISFWYNKISFYAQFKKINLTPIDVDFLKYLFNKNNSLDYAFEGYLKGMSKKNYQIVEA